MFVGESPSVFKRANLVSMSKAITENDRNVSTKTVAATFEKEKKISSEEVYPKRVRRQYGFFDAQKSGYGIKKVNYLGNTILYLNQAYVTVKKSKKIYYFNFFILA